MPEAKITVSALDLASDVFKRVTDAMKQTGAATSELGTTSGSASGQVSALGKYLEELTPSTVNAHAAFADMRGTLNEMWEHPTAAVGQLASAVLKDLAPALGTLGPVAGVAGAALAVMGAIALELGEKAARIGANLNDLSEKTGIAVPQVAALSAAATIAGGSFEQIANGINLFQRNLAENSTKATEGLQRIGLSVSDIKNLSPDQQFLTIASAIRSVEDPTQRTAAAMEVFGRQGREMIPLLMKPLDELVAKSKELGVTWSEDDAKAAEAFEMQVNALKLEVEQLGINLGRNVLPVLKLLAEHAREAGTALIKGADGGVAWDAAAAAAEGQTAEFHAVLAVLGLEAAGMPEKFAKMAASTDDAKKKLQELKDAAFDAAHAPDKAVEAWKAWALSTHGVAVSMFDAKEAEKDLDDQHKALVESQKKSNEEAQKAAELWREYNSVGASVADTIDQMDGATVDGIRYDLQRGQTQETLIKVYGVTKEQMRAIVDSEKEETAALDAEISNIEASRKARDEANKSIDKQVAGMHTLLDLGVQLGSIQLHADPTKGLFSSMIELAPDLSQQASKHITELMKTNLTAGFHDMFATDIPHAVVAAIEGGGDAWAAGAHIIGQQFGANLGKSITDSIASHVDADKILGGDGGLLGKLFSGDGIMSGIMSGGLSTAIGAGVGLLQKGIAALFHAGGPSQEELAGRAGVADFAKSLDEAATVAQKAAINAAVASGAGKEWATVMISVRDAYLATGHTEQQAEQATSALFAAEKQGGAAVAAQLATINGVFRQQQIETALVSAGVGDIVTRAKNLGEVLPDSVKASITQLAGLKGVTDDEKQALLALAQTTAPSFDQLTQTAQKYGITLSSLGPQFEQANLEKTAKGLLGDFDQLTQSGANVGGVLFGMRTKFGDMVAEAVHAGAAIPDSMRPMITELIRSGNLVDSAGNKFTDLSKIQFEDTPVDQGMVDLDTKVHTLIDSLVGDGGADASIAQVAASLANVPDKDIAVRIHVLYPEGGIPDLSGLSASGAIPSHANEAYDISRPHLAIVGDAVGDDENVVKSGTIRDALQGARRQGAASASLSTASLSTAAMEGKLDAVHGELKSLRQTLTRMLETQPAMLKHALRGA